MKKYKYIGTEEQLVERGFVRDNDNSDEYAVWYDKDCLENPKGSDDVLIVATSGSNRVKGFLQFNYTDRPYETITPYIQDLIDANLVEAVENV